MRWISPLLLSASLLGCNLYSPVVAADPLCDESTIVSVGAGTQPVISWTGGCRVSSVRVDTIPWDGTGYVPIAWQQLSQKADIRSPVRVGVDSTSVNLEPVVLGRGQSYQVCLTGARPKQGNGIEVVCVPFTP